MENDFIFAQMRKRRASSTTVTGEGNPPDCCS